MLTKKEIEERHRAKRREMTPEEYIEGHAHVLEQETPRAELLAKWEFRGTGTPVEVLEYELRDAKKLARTYTFASLTVLFLTITYVSNLSSEVFDLPDWTFPVLMLVGGIVVTVSIFMRSSVHDIHYALEAEQEIEQLNKKIEEDKN